MHTDVVRNVAAAAAAKSLQSCLTLCDPIDGSPPSSPVPGILQARTLEWAAISFSNVWERKVKVKSLSRVRLLATPWTTAYQAPPSMGFSRQEYWSGVPLPSPGSECWDMCLGFALKCFEGDFPGGSVVPSPPCEAGGTGSIPDPGDPTNCRAIKPTPRSYWSSCAQKPVLCKEKPPQWEAHTPQQRAALAGCSKRKVCTATKTQHSQKENKKFKCFGGKIEREGGDISMAKHWCLLNLMMGFLGLFSLCMFGSFDNK